MDMSGAQFATLNSMRTGNMIFDMVLAMMVPLFFNIILGDGARDKFMKIWHALFGASKDKSPCVRTITYYSQGGGREAMMYKNHMLHKALSLYLTDEVHVKYPGKACVALTPMHDTFQGGHGVIDKFNPLEGYKMTWNAPDNEWVMINAVRQA